MNASVCTYAHALTFDAGFSCRWAGGRGRDFTLTMNPVRRSPNSGGGGGGGIHGHASSPQAVAAAKKEPMIRMNSRLGATHPARSKTLSGLGGLGGSSVTINMISGGAAAAPGGGGGGSVGGGSGGSTGGGSGGAIRGRGGGALKSRTMDLSNHLSSAASPSAAAAVGGAPGVRPTSRSLSPPPLQHRGQQHQHQHQRPGGTVSHRTWSVSDPEASAQPDTDGEEWRTATPEGGRRSHNEGEGDGVEEGGAGKGTGSLPPLSPRSAAEVNHHRDAGGWGGGSRSSSRDGRHRVSRDSDSYHNSPRQSIRSSSRERADGGGGCRDRDHHHREEGKSPRESRGGGGGGSGGDSPRCPSPSSLKAGRAAHEEQCGSWHGWGGSWEGKERDDEDNYRLPPSPRGSLPRERMPRGSVLDSGEDGEDEGGSGHGHRGSPSPSRPQKSSSEAFKLPQSPSA